MGKLKDKLYYFLVEKNPSIRSEYQGYVDAHQKEHSENRKKHWKLLLKLNWHYRIKRKKTPYLNVKKAPAKNAKKADAAPASAPKIQSKRKLPYLNGAESAATGRRTPLNLVKTQLFSKDVISFDVFDTLVLRPFDDPKTLFTIIGEQLEMYDFYTIRINAEQEARTEAFVKNGNHEVTIDDIYSIIERKTGLNAQEGAKTEFELEKKYCFANPYFKTVFKLLKEADKKIAICSDMYLYENQIAEILEKCGYTGYDLLLVSCEHSTSKRSGGLYEIEKKHFPNASIIHVGDNYQSDIVMAQKCKLDAYYYENVNTCGATYRAEGLSTLTGSIYKGLVNTKLLNGANIYTPQYEFGFLYGGLYVLGFANWIDKTAKQDGVDKILFLSRDGDIYKKVYDKLPNHLNWEYFHWSRIVGMKAGVEENFYEFVVRMVHHKAGAVNKPRVSFLLESLDLGFLVPEMKKYRLKPAAILNQDNKKVVERLFLDNKQQIIDAYKHTIELTYSAIKRAVSGCKKVAIVDIGWAGSGPLGLKYIIENKLGIDCKVECYLAAANHHISQLTAAPLMNGNLKSYLFNQMYNRVNFDSHRDTNKTLNNVLFEMFTQACSPTFFGYSDEGMKFDTPEVENYDTIKQIQSGILDFALNYIKTFGDKNYLLNISGYDAYLPFRMVKKDLKLIKEQFGYLCMSRSVLSDTENQKIETLSELIAQVNL